jgi:hypothetical protein
MTSELYFNMPRDLNRREMLKMAALAVCGLTINHPLLAATNQTSAMSAPKLLEPQNRFSRMVQEYFVERLSEFEIANRQAKAALKTKADAEAYLASVREKIRACFGPFPEKTPLNARITGVAEREVYRIEKIIFESRPGLLVTGNLYVPKDRTVPLPGVIGLCGHSENGKAQDVYQSWSRIKMFSKNSFIWSSRFLSSSFCN